MKAKGVQIYAFYSEWPPGESWYHDSDIEIDLLDPSETYDLADLGLIRWQGTREEEIPSDSPVLGERDVPFEKWFRHWKRTRSVSTFFVTVKNDDVDGFLRSCKDRGWKVRS